MVRKSKRELERTVNEIRAFADKHGRLGWFDALEVVNGWIAPEAFGLTFAEAADEMAAFWTANGEAAPDVGLEHYRENAAESPAAESVPLRTDDAARAVAFLLAVTADGTDVEGRQRTLAFLIDDGRDERDEDGRGGEGVPTAP